MAGAHYYYFGRLMHGPFLVVALVFLALFLAIWFQIYRKAGYSGFLCLLMAIPLLNLLTILWFAFLANWPAKVPKAEAPQA